MHKYMVEINKHKNMFEINIHNTYMSATYIKNKVYIVNQ